MKIIFVSPSKNFFGGEKVLLNLAEFFRENGNTIRIIVPEKGEFTQILQRKDIDFSIVNIKNSVSFNTIPKFLKVIRIFKPDIIHSHGYIVNIISRIISRVSKTPVICVLHVLQDFKYKELGMKAFFYKGLDYITNKIAYKNINIAVSKPVADTAKYLKCKVIHNGLELSSEEYAIPKKIRTFGVVGRIVKIKGFEEILKAFRKLKDNKIKLVIIGKDITLGRKWEKKYKKYVLKNKLNVEFIPFQKNIEDIYKRFDSLILATHEGHEGCPLVLIEALLRKKLVLYSDIKASKYVMQNHGISFKNKNHNDLYYTVKKIIYLERNEIIEKIKNDNEYAKKNFLFDDIAKKHLNVLEKSIKE